MTRTERIMAAGILRVRMTAALVLTIINAPEPKEALADFCMTFGEDFGNAVRENNVPLAAKISDTIFDVICEVAAGEADPAEALRVAVFAADLVQIASGLSLPDENPTDQS